MPHPFSFDLRGFGMIAFILFFAFVKLHVSKILSTETIPDQTLDPGEEYEYVFEASTFISTNDSLIKIKVVDYPSWMDVVDSPSIVGGYSMEDAKKMAFRGSVVYILKANTEIHVVNITDFSNITLVDIIDEFYYPKDVLIVEDTLYVADYLTLKIFDVSDPNKITLQNTISGFVKLIFLESDGNYLYCLDVVNYMGLFIYDITDRENPSVRGGHNNVFANFKYIKVLGDYLYVGTRAVMATTDGFTIFDVSDKWNPQPIFTDGDPFTSITRAVIPFGNITYVSNNFEGVVIYNTTDKSSPELLPQSFDLPDDATVMWFSSYDDILVISASAKGLYFYNISDLENPEFLFRYDVGGYNPKVCTMDKAYIHYVTQDTQGGYYIVSYRDIGLVGTPAADIVCGNITIQYEVCEDECVSSKNRSDDAVYVGSFDITLTGDCGVHGSCSKNETNECVCNNTDGYYAGSFCHQWWCWGKRNDKVDEVCSGQGVCVSSQNCECFENRTGSNCEFWTCFTVPSNEIDDACAGNGVCVEIDRCFCNSGYNSIIPNGPCTEFYCGNLDRKDIFVCSQHGKCVDSHLCDCDPEYLGDDCESWKCGKYKKEDVSIVCSGSGECTKPNKCKCKANRIGEDCEGNLLYYSVMTPILSTFGVFLGILVICAVLGCTLCLILCCVCGIILCCVLISCLSAYIFKQNVGLKKFGELKNFDLLMREQKLGEDTNVAHIKIRKEAFAIRMENVRLIKVLGQGGSTCVVYLAKWKGRQVAFKCFKTRDVCSNQNTFDEFEREVGVLSSVSHPSILRFYGCILQPPRIGIVMEYCENGDLERFLRKYRRVDGGKPYPVKEKIRCICEIIEAGEYLHDRNIIHRDLKLQNVLLDSSERCKLMDFGLSKVVEDMTTEKTVRVGTAIYMSPEVVVGGNYTEKCDIYSMAMIIYVIFVEAFRNPFGVTVATYRLMEEEKIQKSGGGNNSIGGSSGTLSGGSSSSVAGIEFRVANDPNYRPNLETLDEVFKEFENWNGTNRNRYEWIKEVTRLCWDHNPKRRLTFSQLYEVFRDGGLVKKKKGEAVDNNNNSNENNVNGNVVSSRIMEDERYLMLKEENDQVKEEVKLLMEKNKILMEKVKEFDPSFSFQQL